MVIVIPWWLLLVGAAIVGVLALLRWGAGQASWEAVSAEVNLANIGKVTIRPNRDDIQIAHRAWVELATRKAGVPFDSENDVIAEVYDSWYELFGRLRELAMECPAIKLRTNDDTRMLVLTLTWVLNLGMRPHLTTWQARFRRWYDVALANAPPGQSPQEVQRTYPQYPELVADLIRVQAGLQQYMELLKKLATGQS